MDSHSKKKKNVKKITVFILLLLVLAGVVYISTLFSAKNKGEVMHGTLSTRTKEFLKQQENVPESDLFAAQLNAKPDTTSTARLTAKGCFSLKVGIKTTGVQRGQPCSITAFTVSPHATVVAFKQEGSYATLEDDPGVKMRRLNTDLYKETVKKIHGHEFIIFRLKDVSKYESSAFTLLEGAIFAVSITANTNEDLDKKLLYIVNSVEFL